MPSYRDVAQFIKTRHPELAEQNDRDVAEFGLQKYPDLQAVEVNWSDPSPDPSFWDNVKGTATNVFNAVANMDLHSLGTAAPVYAQNYPAQNSPEMVELRDLSYQGGGRQPIDSILASPDALEVPVPATAQLGAAETARQFYQPEIGVPGFRGGVTLQTPETDAAAQQAFDISVMQKQRHGLETTPVGAAMYGVAGSIAGPFIDAPPEAKTAQALNPLAYTGGEMAGIVGQAVLGGAGVAGKLGEMKIFKEAPLLLQAATRGLTSAGITTLHRARDVAKGKLSLGEAIGDVAQSAGAGLVSLVPAIYAPANAWQLLAQPLADLTFDATADALRGRDVGSQEWWTNEALNLALSAGFAVRDVASGAEFKYEQKMMRDDLLKWIKGTGKGEQGYEIKALQAPPERLALPAPEQKAIQLPDNSRTEPIQLPDQTTSQQDVLPPGSEVYQKPISVITDQSKADLPGAETVRVPLEELAAPAPSQTARIAQESIEGQRLSGGGQQNNAAVTAKQRAPESIINPVANFDRIFTGESDPEKIEALGVLRKVIQDDVVPGVFKMTYGRDAMAKLDALGIPYSVIRGDGRELKAWNSKHGNVHFDTDIEIKQIWGDIYAKGFIENGGILTREGGDEFLGILPYHTKEEADAILERLNTQAEEKIKELGLDELPSVKPEYNGLPMGTGYIDWGVAESIPGKYGEVDRAADIEMAIRKREAAVDRAERYGYNIITDENGEVKGYEPRAPKSEIGTEAGGRTDGPGAEIGQRPGLEDTGTGKTIPETTAEPQNGEAEETTGADVTPRAERKSRETDGEAARIAFETRAYQLEHERSEVTFASGIRQDAIKNLGNSVVDDGNKQWSAIIGERIKDSKGNLIIKNEKTRSYLQKVADDLNILETTNPDNIPQIIRDIKGSADEWHYDHVAEIISIGLNKNDFNKWKKDISFRESENEKSYYAEIDEIMRNDEAGQYGDDGSFNSIDDPDAEFEFFKRAHDAGEIEPPDYEGLPAEMRFAARSPNPVNPNSPIHFDMPMSEKSLTGKKKAIGPHKIIKSLQTVAKAPIRIGKFRQKALGLFKTNIEVIRLETANDIPTAVHEVGHAIYKQIMPSIIGDPELKKALSTYRSELVNLGKQLYGKKIPNGGYASEGFAEYMRYKLTTDEAALRAPGFDTFFDDVVLSKNPQLAKALGETRNQIVQWADQGSVKRTKGMVETGRVGPGIIDKVKDFVAPDKWIDEFESLRQFSEEAGARRGRALSIEEDPYLTASALKYTHERRTRYMVDDGMIDLSGNVVGPSLSEAMAIVKGDMDNFRAYLIAKHAIEINAAGKTSGISTKDATQTVKELETPEFELAASKLYEFQRGVLNYLAEADPNMRSVIKKIQEAYEHYVPFFRIFDTDPKTAGKVAQQAQPFKRLTGSGRRIRDPFQVIIEQTENMVKLAHQRMIINQVVKLQDIPGIGKFIEKIPTDRVPNYVKIEDIQKQLKDAGANLDQTDMDALISFFTPAQSPRRTETVLPITKYVPEMRDGQIVNIAKTEWYEMSSDLYDALLGLDVYRMPSVFDFIFGKPARLFKMGTTGMRAAFSLARNPVRDLQALLFQTHSKQNPITMSANWVKLNGEILARMATGKARNEYHDLFVRLGGEMSESLGVDTRNTRRAVKELFQGKAEKIFRHPVELLRDFLQFPETSTRTTELMARAKDVGWKPGNPITLKQSLQLLLDSKRVTIDFSSAGKYAKVINQAIPFFNANIQGTRTFLRTMRRNPMAASIKGLTLFTLPTIALWLQNKDKKWYKDMPWREKFGYWNIETEDEVIRIPRAYEIGNLYSVLPEAVIDSWYQQDPEAVKESLGYILDTSLPPHDPRDVQVIKPLIEQLQNRELFSGMPIVKRAQESGPYDEQYGPYTSKLAIWLGKSMKWSPDRIDHLIRGYFGGLGTDIVSMVGLGREGKIREKEGSDFPVYGTFVRRGGKNGASQDITELYEIYRKASREFNSKNIMRKYDESNLTKYYIAKNAVDVIRLYTELSSNESILKERMSESEKGLRETQADIRDQQVKIAQDALKRIKGEGAAE